MPMSNPNASMIAGATPNLINPGPAMQGPAGLMGQQVGVMQPPVARPMSPQEAMMRAMMRRMG
jgi:hypothetical protein